MHWVSSKRVGRKVVYREQGVIERAVLIRPLLYHHTIRPGSYFPFFHYFLLSVAPSPFFTPALVY